MPTKILSEFTLGLHRASREMPVDALQRWSLERLRPHIPFDAALWASGVYSEDGNPIVHNVVLVNRPLELMADYEDIKDADHLQRRNRHSQGIACVQNAMAEHPDTTPKLVAYLAKWSIVHALACHITDPLTKLATAIALWREDQAMPFGEQERRFLEDTMPHMIDTYGSARILHMERAAQPRGTAGYASAAVDASARLQVATPEFLRRLLLEWPRWQGNQLPAPALSIINGHLVERFVGKRIVLKSTRMNDVFLLQARDKRAVDELSPREHEVAELLCAGGMTYKEIAARLGIAPATVRNHISSIFTKLDVSKQSELAAALQVEG